MKPGDNSRTSLRGAGWGCEPNGFLDEMPARLRSRRFSWLSPAPLWATRNDVLAARLGDPTDELRRRWLSGTSDFLVDRTDLKRPSMLVLGDPGEGDASQYAVVPALRARAYDTDFAIVCSDVIYPAGGAGEYEFKFYVPYRDYPRPIYALPGNHDWYDNLTGFMAHFCDQRAPPGLARRRLTLSRAGVRDLLWRAPAAVDERELARMRAIRGRPEQQARLPGPYYVVDTGPLQLVSVDVGIHGRLDRAQGEWLRRVSAASPNPKVLLTGKPIYVNGRHRPRVIEGGGTVDAIVRAPRHNYVAVIGGDTHNYQRYPVRLADGRTIMHLVNGGGGAFMHATHGIRRVALPGVDEEAFRCYPLRGDSLSFYSRLFDQRLGSGRGRHYVPPAEASAIVAERLGLTVTRPDARTVPVSDRSRRAAGRVYWLQAPHGAFHFKFAEFFDWNEPPLFKSFLRIDASEGQMRVRCFAATGCVGDDARQPEDDLHAHRDADGTWTWTWAGAAAASNRQPSGSARTSASGD